jgi:NAD(P)-dependent dehydrogenase (short-subunit alcohol dehydrogenase family)
MFDLKGKRALITGSAQGIGFSVAKALAEAGATVWINGTNEEKAKRAAQGITGAQIALCDLSSPDCAELLYQKTGDVDILILNVSIQCRRAWNEITDEEFDKQIAVNLKASLKLIQKYAPHMQAQKWGRIITVGSIQQRKPHKDMLIYAAAKAAQENMARNLAKQLAPDGITVNNVAPGVIETPRNSEALSDKEYAKQVIAGIPLGYAGVPQDCNGLILTLCSDAGRYITGADIFIDGGMSL